METTNQIWYDYLTEKLGLDPATFRLTQGSLGLYKNNQDLIRMLNSIPPNSQSNIYYDSSQWNNFNSNYTQILVNLKPEIGGPGIDPLKDTHNYWKRNREYPLYSPTASELKTQLDSQGKKVILSFVKRSYTEEDMSDFLLSPVFDDTASKTRGHLAGTKTTALLSGRAREQLIEINQKLYKSKATVKGVFQKYSSTSVQAGNWLYRNIFSKLLRSPDRPDLWKHGKNQWDNYFGDQGVIQRLFTACYVIDGMDMQVTYSAKFSAEEYRFLSQQQDLLVWPFFISRNTAGYKVQYSLEHDSTFITRHTSPPGSPLILGLDVSSVFNAY